MKCDVIVCFYRTHTLWPYVAKGLALNQDYINKVIVSNDEEWDHSGKEAIYIANESVDLTIPVELIGHPRNGMRQAQCFNDAVAKVESDWVLQIDDDVVLDDEAAAKFLAQAKTGLLLTGKLHDIARGGFSVNSPHKQPVLRLDRRYICKDKPEWKRPYIISNIMHVRDNLLFYNKMDYLMVGGHDEGYHDGQEHGYGFVDFDFGLRWFKTFGLNSYRMVDGAQAFHMSGLKPGHQFSLANQARLDSRLEAYLESIGEGECAVN